MMRPSPRHSIFPAIEGPDARFQCGSGVVKCHDEGAFPLCGQEQIIGSFFEQTFMVSLPRTQSMRIGRTTGLLDEGGVVNQVRNVFSGSFAHAFSPFGVGRRRSVMGGNPHRPTNPRRGSYTAPGISTKAQIAKYFYTEMGKARPCGGDSSNQKGAA